MCVRLVTWPLWMNISSSLWTPCNWAKEAQSWSWHIHEDERTSLRFFRLCCSEWLSAVFSRCFYSGACLFCFRPARAGLGWFCVSGVLWERWFTSEETPSFQPIQTQRWVNKHSGQPDSDDNWPSLAVQCWCASVLMCQGSHYLLAIVQMCALGLVL